MRTGFTRVPVALRLAARELRGGLRGFRIFIACLALGVAAIASVQSVSSAIVQGLRDDGQAILGGDISLRRLYQPADPDQRAFLDRSSRAVTHFKEMRAMARRADGERSTLIEFKGVDRQYPLFGRVELRSQQEFRGLLEPAGGSWGALVERSVLERLGLGLGEEILVGDGRYQVRGVIVREPDRVGGGGRFGLGPRVMVSIDSLAETGLLQTGSLVYHHYRIKLPVGSDLEAASAQLEQVFHQPGWRLRDYRNASPRVERMVKRLAQFLTLVGLTALLVGGVGVSNAVKAYLDGKLNTIAVLKCLGARNRTVFQIYMAQILVLAAVGISAGLLLGALVPPLTALLLKDLLPFELALSAHPAALGLSALFGLLVTLVFSVWPLARVHQVPAGALFRDAVAFNDAWPAVPYVAVTLVCSLLLAGLAVVSSDDLRIAVWFVFGAAATMLLFRLAAWLVLAATARIKRPRHPGLRLALANLQRPGAPTANVVLSLGLGLTVLVAVVLIESNMSAQVQDSIPEQAPAFFFIDIQADQIAAFEQSVAAVPGVSEVHKVPYMRGRITAIKGEKPEHALRGAEYEWMIRGDRGLTYSALQPHNTTIIAGEWWQQDYAGSPLLSIHKDVSQGFGVGLGDTITLNVLGRDIDARVANIRQLDWTSMQINFAIMFSPEPLRHAPHTYIATVAATDRAEPEVQKLVAERFPGITVVRIKDALERVNDILGKIGAAVRSVAGVTLIAGTLVLAGAIAAGHRRRVYDSVVLKVLGATRRELMQAFVLEYGLLGGITAGIAGVIGTLTAWAVLTQVMRTDWVFVPSVVVMTSLICTLITLGLGFAGTWRALGQRAAPLLRNE